MSDYNQSRYYRHLDGWTLARGSITFDGTAGKGAQGTVTLFDVTGAVEVGSLLGECATSHDGATATIAFGVTGNTTMFCDPFTATNIDAGMVLSGGGNGFVSGGVASSPTAAIINADIIATVATADVTAGVLELFVWWRPLSADGNVALGSAMEQI